MPERRVGACVAEYSKSSRLTRTSLNRMRNEPDPAESSLSEPWPPGLKSRNSEILLAQKQITDAIVALDGVIEAKIETMRSTSLRSAGHK